MILFIFTNLHLSFVYNYYKLLEIVSIWIATMYKSMIGVVTYLVSQILFAASPAGLWMAQSPFFSNRTIGIVKVNVVNGVLCGSLVKIIPINGRMNFSRFSSALPNNGLIVMCNYKQTADGWQGGLIYEQTSASIYPSTAKLSADGNKLYVTGQSGVISQTATWTRYK